MNVSYHNRIVQKLQAEIVHLRGGGGLISEVERVTNATMTDLVTDLERQLGESGAIREQQAHVIDLAKASVARLTVDVAALQKEVDRELDKDDAYQARLDTLEGSLEHMTTRASELEEQNQALRDELLELEEPTP